MKCARYLLALAVVSLPAVSHAQDFGVMESAETINKGNFKILANPIIVNGDMKAEVAVAAAFGYGFTDRFDAEAKFAFDQTTFIGGDAELWLIKDPHSIDLSVSAGFQFGNSNLFDQTGVDVTVITSRAVTSSLDIYGALDSAFKKYRGLANSDYTQLHLVPGIEYKLRSDLDLVAEGGFSMNDRGQHYISAGIADDLR